MIKMQLLDMNIIRAIMYGFGFLCAIYVLYDIKITKKTTIDYFLSASIYFIMNISNNFIVLKEIAFILVAMYIIFYRHKIPLYSSLIFTLVTLNTIVFTYPVAIMSLVLHSSLINAIVNQSEGIYGYIAVIVPSLIFIVIYVSSSWVVKKLIDVDNVRLKTMYNVSSILNIILIILISVMLDYIVNNLGVRLGLRSIYFLMSFSFLGILAIPIIQLNNIRIFIKSDKKSMKLEEELAGINDSRLLAHRYSHNLNNIILTINQLSKENNPEKLQSYLEKLEFEGHKK